MRLPRLVFRVAAATLVIVVALASGLGTTTLLEQATPAAWGVVLGLVAWRAGRVTVEPAPERALGTASGSRFGYPAR